MKNVTLAIDEELLEKARGLAERRKTTLNAMVRSLLEHEVEQEDTDRVGTGGHEAADGRGSWEKRPFRSSPISGVGTKIMPNERIECFLDSNVLLYAASERKS